MKIFNLSTCNIGAFEGSSLSLPKITSPYQQAKYLEALDSSYEEIKSELGASREDQLVITSCVEEAFSQVVMSHFFNKVLKDGYQHLLISSVEKASMLMTLDQLKPLGCHVEVIEVSSQGQLTLDHVKAKIQKRTSFLSLSFAHPLTGVIQPIQDIAKFCEEHQITLHVDITSIIGTIFFRFEDYLVDYVTAQIGSKGIVLAKKLSPMSSLIFREDSADQYGGCSNLEDLKALLKGLKNHLVKMEYRNLNLARLKHHFEKRLKALIPEAKILLTHIERLPHISVVSFPYVSNEYLLFLLYKKGVLASIGGEGNLRLDQLLLKSGVSMQDAKSSIAFAFPDDFTDVDLVDILERVHMCYKQTASLRGSFSEALTSC